MGDDGIGREWFIVAVVAIGFIRWLIESFKENRRRKNAPEEEEFEFEPDEEVWTPPSSERRPPPPLPNREPPPPARADGGLSDELRKFILERQQGTAPERERPVPPPATVPPAIPTPAPRAPALSSDEQRALEALKQGAVRPPVRPAKNRRRGNQRAARLRGLLHDPGSLHQAVLIKEILDPPKGLQERTTS